jgi:hypothetical protein
MIVLSLNTSTAAKSCMLCGLLHPRRLRLGLLRLPNKGPEISRNCWHHPRIEDVFLFATTLSRNIIRCCILVYGSPVRSMSVLYACFSSYIILHQLLVLGKPPWSSAPSAFLARSLPTDPGQEHVASDLSDSLFNPSHLLQAPSSEGETSPPLAKLC